MRNAALVKTCTAIFSMLLFCVMSSCATWNITTKSQITDQQFSSLPHKKTAQVKVIKDLSDIKNYTQIGSIHAVGIIKTQKEDLVDALRIAAARMGADAVAEISFGIKTVNGGDEGGMVCPDFTVHCTYEEYPNTLTGIPYADAKAIIFTKQVQ